MLNKSLIPFLLAIAFQITAHANVGESFGFGSKSAALSNSLVSDPDVGFAAYTNPAKLGAMGTNRFSLGYGLIAMKNSFNTIGGIVTQNDTVADQVTKGDVADDYKMVLGQAIGLAFQIAPQFHHLAFGLVTYIPLQHTIHFDSGETYVPEYVLYRSRNQRPQFEFGLGGEIANGFTFGLGIHVGYTITSRATTFLQTSSGKPSTLRFGATMKPHLSPVLGFRYESPADKGTSFWGSGLVIRLPNNSRQEVRLDSSARTLGNLAALDFNFNASASVYYDPFTIELGSFVHLSDRSKLLLELDYQQWSKFQSPTFVIDSTDTQSCQGTGCGVIISPSQAPEHPYKDVFVPRIGHEYYFGTHVLRAGYAYHPGILKPENTSGDANFLDPSKHILSLGMGFPFEHCFTANDHCSFDVHASYQKLITQEITKSGSTQIGAPGYSAGGKIYGGGVSFSVDL